MAITRRALGTHVAHNAQLPQNKTQNNQVLKRPLVSGNSPGQTIPTKRKNIQNNEKENQTFRVESIERKITEIKISEDRYTAQSTRKTTRETTKEIHAVKSKPSVVKEEPKTTKSWKQLYHEPEDLPGNVEDYDRTQLIVSDSEPVYAHDIFRYLQAKEKQMLTVKYMHKQPKVNEKMRAILIDWLVEVQQNFELFHETLYLSVKYVDHYLMKKTIPSSRLQLLGLTAVFVAAKFEERSYPCIDDFIYMCDDAYTKEEFIQMEMDILSTLTFDVNFPLSYSFLRRYSRCASTSIETLTLARYILESSLLGYVFIDELDSKLSAAALLLANRMQNITPSWTPTLTYYSGYAEPQLEDLVKKLNKFIIDISNSNTKKSDKPMSENSRDVNILGENIFVKYSDQVFHKVAKIPPLPL